MPRHSAAVVIEFFTARIRGHYEGDSQKYRNDPAAPADPLALARDLLIERGTSLDLLDAMVETVRGEVRAAVDGARAAADPTLMSAFAEVYA